MGGKSASYSPSASDIAAQQQAYKQQWDLEAAQERQMDMLDDKEYEAKNQKEEISNRKGINQILGNKQRGFTKKINNDDTSLGDSNVVV